MNCETCNAKIPSLKTRRDRVNDTLHSLGLKYYTSLGESLNAIDEVLVSGGFSTHYAPFIIGNSNRHHVEVGEGLWLTLHTYRHESGRYEVVAYVN